MQEYRTLKEFYPYYLSEHQDRRCRLCHFVGTNLVVLVFIAAIVLQQWLWLVALPFCGYGFAWVGHFVFEKNRPATFTYPLYSFLCDWVMWKDMWTGKIAI